MTINSKDISVQFKDNGYKKIKWLTFDIYAFLHKITNGKKRWKYILRKSPTDKVVFEVFAIGLPWSEKRFRESFGQALDYKDNAQRVIKALFNDFTT
jgi:hypothetical protein